MQENQPISVNSNNSGSLPEVNLHIAKGDERLAAVLIKEITDIRERLHKVETKKIIEETQLPPEVLEANGLLPKPPRRLAPGRGWRPLLRSEIEDAIAHSPFCSQQAKYLGVSVQAYRKYAKQHGLWKPQPHTKGSRKAPKGPETGKYPLSKILAGEFNGNKLVLEYRVRAKLLAAEVFPEECSHCGYKEKHIITKRVPLLIDHLDGDHLNWKKDNIRFLCWNCTVQVGRGYMCGHIRKFDPNLLQQTSW